MSVNFYNSFGLMAIVDLHGYKPGPPAWPHVVCAPLWWFATAERRVPSVTSCSHPMVQGGLDLCMVLHIPAGPPPGAVTATMILAAIHSMSGSVAYLAVHKVTAARKDLACCVSGMIGYNVNCNEPIDLPTGLVFQCNTVQTQPTLGDYVGAFVAYALDAILAFSVGAFLDLVTENPLVEVIVQTIVRLLPEIPGIGINFDPGGVWGPYVQKAIDGD
jgi:hypothetical protein